MRLNDKVAIITGSAAGIGAAAAEIFVREGARVLLADRNGEGVRRVADRLGPAAVALEADVSRGPDAKRMVESAVSHFGRLDILVNNAGYGIPGPVVTTEEADWDALMAGNLKGVF